jgi:hypothetical protein
MSNKKLLIATPAYCGLVCSDYTQALLYTCMLLSKNNIQFEVKFINNQIVTRARNMLCSIFMDDSSFTHMIFIDADVVWTPTDVLMLLEHNLECVIGIYPNKKYYWDAGKLTIFPSSVVDKSDTKNGKLIKIEKAATGFMLLKKSALERIKKDIETFILPGANGNVILYNYFDCNVVNNDYLTEDYYFSYLFNKNGGTIYADTRINLLHIGNHQYGSIIKN